MKTLRWRGLGSALIILFIFSSCSKEELIIEQSETTLTSDYGTKYQVTIAKPQGYDERKSYGVIVVADGPWMMDLVLQNLRGHALHSDYFVVGIGYAEENRRLYDYTPTETREAGTGNADAFIDFIYDDVYLQLVVSHYNIDPDPAKHIFIGHSLGGLLGTYMFLNHHALFGKYLLMSSALMWDSQSIFRLEKELRAAAFDQHAQLFLATGTLEPSGFQVTHQYFTGLLQNEYPNTYFKWLTYKNTDHTGIKAPGLRDGLKFLLYQNQAF